MKIVEQIRIKTRIGLSRIRKKGVTVLVIGDARVHLTVGPVFDRVFT